MFVLDTKIWKKQELKNEKKEKYKKSAS